MKNVKNINSSRHQELYQEIQFCVTNSCCWVLFYFCFWFVVVVVVVCIFVCFFIILLVFFLLYFFLSFFFFFKGGGVIASIYIICSVSQNNLHLLWGKRMAGSLNVLSRIFYVLNNLQYDSQSYCRFYFSIKHDF